MGSLIPISPMLRKNSELVKLGWIGVLFFAAICPVKSWAQVADSDSPEGLKPSVFTRANARTFNFTVPAPRGQILDRHGRVLANNRVRNYFAVQLPSWEGAREEEVVTLGRYALRGANSILGTSWQLDDETILSHYKYRRWFPLRISPKPLTDEQEASLSSLITTPQSGQPGNPPGPVLQPCYLREYPAGQVAGHITGYVGRETPLETKEIRKGELLFENLKGRSGLEKSFDAILTGKDGVVNYTFDESGILVGKRVITPAEPGGSVVTTLNLEMQMLAEAQLIEKSRRGAAVVVDAETGDILALASHPGFDPNLFVPYIGKEEFGKLNNDPDIPLFNRAISAAYPPGSTFKPFVSCAVLTYGPVRPWTLYSGPPSLWIGDREFKNWNTKHEGTLNVVSALKRSCNTWFYQAAMDTGSAPIIRTAADFGFGQSSELPLAGEAVGNLPETPDLPAGRTANISIGQGEVLATPVQLAIAIAAIANGRHYPQARLISQTQDFRNKVTEKFPNKSRGYMPYSMETIAAVQRGMDEVVNAEGGTALRARQENIRVAGKTGTAQWSSGDGKIRNLAWFCGFTFTTNPKLAFAVVYEGELGETVSGGALAAPIAGGIMKGIYDNPTAFAMADPDLIEPPVLKSAERQSEAQVTARPVGSASGNEQSGAAARPVPTQATPAADSETPFPNNRRRGPVNSLLRGIFGRR